MPDIVQLDVSLRDHVDGLFAAHEKMHAANEKAYDRDYAAMQKAIDTLVDQVRENKKDGNEWRNAMTDREKRFASKDEADGRERRIATLEGAEFARVERERGAAVDKVDEKAEWNAVVKRIGDVEVRMWLAIGALSVIFVVGQPFVASVVQALHLP